ncbi:MAG: hypothetical protein ABH827_01285 [bacterium]
MKKLIPLFLLLILINLNNLNCNKLPDLQKISEVNLILKDYTIKLDFLTEPLIPVYVYLQLLNEILDNNCVNIKQEPTQENKYIILTATLKNISREKFMTALKKCSDLHDYYLDQKSMLIKRLKKCIQKTSENPNQNTLILSITKELNNFNFTAWNLILQCSLECGIFGLVAHHANTGPIFIPQNNQQPIDLVESYDKIKSDLMNTSDND